MESVSPSPLIKVSQSFGGKSFKACGLKPQTWNPTQFLFELSCLSRWTVTSSCCLCSLSLSIAAPKLLSTVTIAICIDVLQQENSPPSIVREKQVNIYPTVHHSPPTQDPLVSPPTQEDLWHLPGRLSELNYPLCSTYLLILIADMTADTHMQHLLQAHQI